MGVSFVDDKLVGLLPPAISGTASLLYNHTHYTLSTYLLPQPLTNLPFSSLSATELGRMGMEAHMMDV